MDAILAVTAIAAAITVLPVAVARSITRRRTSRLRRPPRPEPGIRRSGLVHVTSHRLAIDGATCHRIAWVCPVVWPAGLTMGEIIALAEDRAWDTAAQRAHLDHLLLVDPYAARPERAGMLPRDRWLRWQGALLNAADVHLASHDVAAGGDAA